MIQSRNSRLTLLVLPHHSSIPNNRTILKRALRFGVILLFSAFSIAASPAQSVYFTKLLNFSSSTGIYPFSSLTQTSDGSLYGATLEGGDYFQGTIYKISTTGSLTTVHSFDGADGSSPFAALVQGSDGSIYGTTEAGGGIDNNLYGTVFKLSANGTLATLHSFEPNNSPDGYDPQGWLVQGNDGAFYGTTVDGGRYFSGTVFRITADGVLATLHAFEPQNGSDGAYPYAGLVLGRDGNFYGTTTGGGRAGNSGTIFEMTPAGALTVLHSFNSSDGGRPFGGLIQARDGNFYGVTLVGGAGGVGTIFKMTPGGALTTLHSFGRADGSNPSGTLVQGSDGNFYGTTQAGGVSGNCTGGCGTIFKMSPNGTLTTLHSFNGLDGATPYAGLMQASDGFFYGTTVDGGIYGYGTVFRVIAPQPCAGCRR